MIENRRDLKRILRLEKKIYFKSREKMFEAFLVQDKDWLIFRFQKFLRKSEYHYNKKKKSVWHRLCYIFYRRKKNRLGVRLGIEIWENTFDEGLHIWHGGDIVINGYTKVGKNCQLKGCNCIGNNGKDLNAPKIGDNFSLGNGAKVIGNIVIADNVEVGAGAIVVRNCEDVGAILVGVPARNVNK